MRIEDAPDRRDAVIERMPTRCRDKWRDRSAAADEGLAHVLERPQRREGIEQVTVQLRGQLRAPGMHDVAGGLRGTLPSFGSALGKHIQSEHMVRVVVGVARCASMVQRRVDHVRGRRHAHPEPELEVLNVSGNMLQIHRELEEASLASGAHLMTTLRRVVLPLALPGIISGWSLLFIVFMRQFTLPAMLSSPGSQVATIVLFQEWEAGQIGHVAAVGCAIMAVCVPFLVVARRLVGLRVAVDLTVSTQGACEQP